MPSLLETLSTYVPGLVVAGASKDPAKYAGPTSTEFPAAILFADISGFTALTERLTQRSGSGDGGAEELVAILNRYLGRLVDIVLAHGGDVVKFAGDALLAVWPAESEAALGERVVTVARCALAIQGELHNAKVDGETTLALKLAVGSGTVGARTLGGVFGRYELLVTGDPLSQVGRGNDAANPGDTILSPEAQALAGAAVAGRPALDRPDHPARGGLVLESVLGRAAGADWSRPAAQPEGAKVIRTFIPAAIRNRLDAGQSDWLAELRRLTVLFVNLPDLNHTTPLDKAQAVMAAMQTSLYRYEGSINKISVDDKGASLVAALGLPPLAHEDDAARATLAALAVRKALSDLGVRCAVGVTTGRVFCGVVGSPARREYTIMGDAVNLAARLMQKAVAGLGNAGILCDATTAADAAERAQFTPLEPVKLKGKAVPVAVFVPAAKPHAVAASAPVVEAAIVERHAERGQLAAALQTLLSRKTGGRILIEGEAGIGKSLLLAELLGNARRAGALVLDGTADSVETSTPYFAWRRAFAALFDLASAPADTARKQTHVLRQLPADGATLSAAPLLGAALPFDWPDNEETAQLIGQKRAERLAEVVCRTLAERADSGPVVLSIEDAHWADTGSIALLNAVAAKIPGLLIVAAARPAGSGGAGGNPELARFVAAEGLQRLTLDRLSPAGTVALAARRLGTAALPEAVATLIRERAEGNPFFAEELAYAMRDAGLIRVESGTCTIAPTAGDPARWTLPDTVQGVIVSRIDRLTPPQQMTMKVASVVGRVFSYRTLLDVHPIESDKAAMPEHFSVLRGLDLTPLERPSPDLAYIFKHATTHKVAYDLMPAAQRRQLHRSVAEWYELTGGADVASICPLLAHHWRQAAQESSPDLVKKAVGYYRQAAEQAVRAFVNQEAIEFYKAGIALCAMLPAGVERDGLELSLQLGLGAVLMATRGYAAQEVKAAYERARTLSESARERDALFPALRGLWAFHIGRAEFNQAKRTAEYLLSLAAADGDPALSLEAHRAMGNAVFWLGDLRGAREHMQRAIDLYTPERDRTLAFLYGQDPSVANRGMQAWPLALMGNMREAFQRGGEAVNQARELNHPYSLGYALVHDMCARQYFRQAQATLTRADEVIALASEKGFPNWLLAGMILKGWALGQLGRPEEGLGVLRQGIDFWRGSGAELCVPYFLGLLAETQTALRAHGDALATLDDALAVAHKNHDRWFEPELHRLRAETLTALGRGAEAGPSWERAESTAREQGADLFAERARASAAAGAASAPGR
jgi:class 3 adenylate cyclase/predicted ATPase